MTLCGSRSLNSNDIAAAHESMHGALVCSHQRHDLAIGRHPPPRPVFPTQLVVYHHATRGSSYPTKVFCTVYYELVVPHTKSRTHGARWRSKQGTARRVAVPADCSPLSCGFVCNVPSFLFVDWFVCWLVCSSKREVCSTWFRHCPVTSLGFSESPCDHPQSATQHTRSMQSACHTAGSNSPPSFISDDA